MKLRLKAGKFLNLILLTMLLFGLILMCSCGGSSGAKTEFSGTVAESSIATQALKIAGGLADVEVCALGVCDLTDEQGNWSFDVKEGSFESGKVLFTLNGPRAVDQFVVDSVDEESEEVKVTIEVNSDAKVAFFAVTQNDFDDDLDDEVDEEASDIADNIDDEADDFVDDIDEEIDEV